jgi:hypothetical protein
MRPPFTQSLRIYITGNLLSPSSLSRLHKASAVLTQLTATALDYFSYYCNTETADPAQICLQSQQQLLMWLIEAAGALKLEIGDKC